MTDHNDVIERINTWVNEYHMMEGLDGHVLTEQLKHLTSSLYYLEGVRSDFHNKWCIEVKRLTETKLSVSRSEIEAHVKYPEMYKLRRIMDAAYKVVEGIRSNISYVKQENAENAYYLSLKLMNESNINLIKLAKQEFKRQ